MILFILGSKAPPKVVKADASVKKEKKKIKKEDTSTKVKTENGKFSGDVKKTVDLYVLGSIFLLIYLKTARL